MQKLRPLLSFILISLTVLGILNVATDQNEVEPLARSLVCTDCSPFLSSGSKSPIQMKFEYKTETSRVTVTCRKAYIFLGDYSCEKTDEL